MWRLGRLLVFAFFAYCSPTRLAVPPSSAGRSLQAKPCCILQVIPTWLAFRFQKVCHTARSEGTPSNTPEPKPCPRRAGLPSLVVCPWAPPF